MYNIKQNITLVDCIKWQKEWALKTFGAGKHTKGLLKHIEKEIEEIRADPTDVEEWIDIIILAMEGAWRATGAYPQRIAANFEYKMKKNENRKWPTEFDTNQAIEHLKTA